MPMEQKVFAENTTNQYHTVFFNQLGNIQWVIFLALQKGHKLSEDHVAIGIRNYL
jgi:hypothetical protein